MTLPEWKIISNFGSQVIAHLPERSELAIAEVDAAGIILSVNAPGKRAWAWQEGHRLPNALLIALSEAEPGETVTLPARPGGLSAFGIRMAAGSGWLLIGFRPPEDQLAERTSSFKSLIENIPVLITRLQGDGVVRYANAETLRTTGHTTEEIVGRPFWLEAVHPEDRWRLTEAIRQALGGDRAVVGVRFLSRHRGVRLGEMHLYPTGDQPAKEVECVVFDVTERTEIEQALFQTEALYRTFLEQSPVGMLHLDAAGTVTFENHPFRQIVGEDAEDAWIGRSVFQIPGLDPHLRSLLTRLLGAGEAFHGVEATYARSANHPLQSLIVRGTPILHPNGSIIGGVLMVEDVTQQKRRDEELRLRDRYSQAEAALRKAALADPDETTFLREAARILGETAGTDRFYFLIDGIAARCTSRAAWSRSGQPTPPPLSFDLRTLRLHERAVRNPHPLHVHPAAETGTMQALLDVTGAASAVWAPFYDEGRLAGFALFERTSHPAAPWSSTEVQLIEQLVRLFEALRASILVRDRYRHIVATIDDGLFHFTFDEAGERRYLFLTPQTVTLAGFSPGEGSTHGTLILRWSDIVHPDDRAVFHAHDEALRQGRESRATYRIRRRDGAVRWLQERGTPRRDPGGGITVSGILSDVTEQKATEAALREAKQRAESADQLKSAFLATMSHELRTPMGAINGFAELLARELEELSTQTGLAFPAQVDEFVLAIRENAQKLLGLLNDLLDLSNLEDRAFALRRTPTPLHDVVLRCTSKVAVALSQKAIDLRVDLDPAEPVVSTDPLRLEQVLDNLLSNAAKFTDAGTVIVRTRRVSDDAVTVEVIDTGIGIAEEYLERLFTPFLQEDQRLNRRYEGSGLGLAIAKRLLDMMGGRIDVTSRKGEGSTFRITLPAGR